MEIAQARAAKEVPQQTLSKQSDYDFGAGLSQTMPVQDRETPFKFTDRTEETKKDAVARRKPEDQPKKSTRGGPLRKALINTPNPTEKTKASDELQHLGDANDLQPTGPQSSAAVSQPTDNFDKSAANPTTSPDDLQQKNPAASGPTEPAATTEHNLDETNEQQGAGRCQTSHTISGPTTPDGTAEEPSARTRQLGPDCREAEAGGDEAGRRNAV